MGSRTTDSRAVNNLLHTLRGEQFRHSQNLIHSRTHVSSTVTHNSPTLPVHFNQSYRSTGYYSNVEKAETLKESALRSCPGPGPPKSWTPTSKDVAHETARAWRTEALSLMFSHFEPPINDPSSLSVPPLTQLCLQKIFTLTSSTQFIQSVVPFLPSHLRRDLIRHTAIESPLSSVILFALYEPEGHVDGEVIVIGPNATLRDDYFIRSVPSMKQGEVEDWDSELPMPEPLRRFILVNSRLAVSTLLTLPPTITHLALIDLKTTIPLHRLPATCPMLIVLDLSYNAWLGELSKEAGPFERVDWCRWSCLRVLGLRECHVTDELRIRVNKDRWDDVDIIK